MSEDKSLKIGMKFDDKGGKAAASSLGDLKKKADDFNKSVGSLNKSLKSLNVELKLKVKDFGALGKEIEKTGKVFQTQIKDVTSYTKALERLNQALRASGSRSGPNVRRSGATITGGVAQQVGSSAIAGGLGGLAGHAPSNPVFVQIVGGQGGGMGGQAIPMPGGGFVFVPPGRGRGGGGGGPGGGGPNSWLRGGQNINAFGQQFTTRDTNNIKVAATVGQSMANFIQEMKLLPAQNQATVKGLRGGIFKNMMGGDFSDALALSIMNREGKSVTDKFGGRGAIGAGSFLGGVGNIAGGFAGGPAGVGAGIGGALGATIKTSVAGGKEAQEAQTMQAGIEAVKGMNPIQMAVFQNLMANASGGLAATRRLGSGMNAAWQGVGQGMSPNESWQFLTQGANQFGGNVMMGSQQMKKTRGGLTPEAVAYGKLVSAGRWNGTGSGEEEDQYNAFLKTDAAYQTKMVKGGMGGGLGQAALGFQNKGFNRDLLTQLMGNMQAMGGGSDSSRVQAAEKMFTRAVSEGVKKGIDDIQTLEALSTAVAEATISRTGGVMSGTGQLVNMLSAGMGAGTANPIAVQQRMEGLTAFGAAQQSNPFLKNRSMAHAVDTLGPGAEVADVMALSGATPQELLSSGGRLGASGITKEQRMAQLTKTLDSTLTMAAASSPKMAALLAKYDGDYGKALKDPAFVAAASNSLAANIGGFQDYQNNVRGLEAFSQLDRSKLSDEQGSSTEWQKLKDRGGGFLGARSAQAKTEAQALSEAFTPEHQALFSQAIASIGDIFKSTADWNVKANLNDAVVTIKALESLIDKIAKLDVAKVQEVENHVKPNRK